MTEERRHQPLRRQFNESFCSPDGQLSIAKTMAVAAQLVLLYHLGADFTVIVARGDSLAWILVALIAPDTIKKWIAMRNGGSRPPQPPR